MLYASILALNASASRQTVTCGLDHRIMELQHDTLSTIDCTKPAMMNAQDINTLIMTLVPNGCKGRGMLFMKHPP